MKKIKETEKGFYGCYWSVEGSKCAIIAMLGDDCEDHMAKIYQNRKDKGQTPAHRRRG